MIIAGFSAIGKTELAKKYPKKVIDLESSNYSWIIKDEFKHLDEEKKKTNEKIRIKNFNYPENYMKAIIEAEIKYPIVLISNQSFGLKLINELREKVNSEIYIAFPNNDPITKEIYINRYKQRGNIDAFIDRMIDGWDDWISEFENEENNLLRLHKNETLEDILINNKMI